MKPQLHISKKMHISDMTIAVYNERAITANIGRNHNEYTDFWHKEVQ